MHLIILIHGISLATTDIPTVKLVVLIGMKYFIEEVYIMCFCCLNQSQLFINKTLGEIVCTHTFLRVLMVMKQENVKQTEWINNKNITGGTEQLRFSKARQSGKGSFTLWTL